MRLRYLKMKHWLLLSLGGMLGLQVGCSPDSAVEYGCPEAIYHVKGTVVDREGHPVEGIGVVEQYTDSQGLPAENIPCENTTDAEGRFDVRFHHVGTGAEQIHMLLHDTDGEAHGSYADTTVGVSFEGAQFTGGNGHWYEGEATREVQITL